MEIKRQRGGQPGNDNAVKHGYYSRELNKQQKLDFDLASGMEGIQEEITLLRYKIKQAVISGDVADLIPLSKITYALEKLIRTNKQLFATGHDYENSMRKIFREVIAMEGSTHLTRVMAHKQYPDEFPPVPPTNQNEKTDKPQNEARLS